MSCLQRLTKRLFDIVFSALGLLVLFPIIVISLIMARKSTGESGLFIQQRVGMNGKLFKIMKIRTMKTVLNLESKTITTSNDVRHTKVGRFLRKFKIDELPQLWSVLIGDMSFVGPRPDVPGYADNLTGHHRDILSLRPGITGPASIKYSEEEMILSLSKDPQRINDEIIYPDKVKINFNYLNNWSFWLDVYYILITLKVVSVPEELVLSSESLDIVI